MQPHALIFNARFAGSDVSVDLLTPEENSILVSDMFRLLDLFLVEVAEAV
jgi:hypothetical protein